MQVEGRVENEARLLVMRGGQTTDASLLVAGSGYCRPLAIAGQASFVLVTRSESRPPSGGIVRAALIPIAG